MIVKTRQPTIYQSFLIFLILVFSCLAPVFGMAAETADNTTVTVLCYMNGDNDLSEEVLYSLDMIETAGSSDSVNVIALVDGHHEWLGRYDTAWARTRLVKVDFDTQIGVINATVLDDWGEANLADPRTLERFVRLAIERYPADRYMFYAFAHSQGIIDTRAFSIQRQAKTLSICNDDTSNQKMDLKQFHDAIKLGLDDRQFEIITLFSCLTNMVEIGYALSDITRYFVASQDEIRLINEPSGNVRIRGLQFEAAIDALNKDPAMKAKDIGRILVNSHIDDYIQAMAHASDSERPAGYRLAAGMALIECSALPMLVQQLDALARVMIAGADDPLFVEAMREAMKTTPRFASFLNLEYYDLHYFVRRLRDNLQHTEAIQACDAVLDRLNDQVLVYERHTLDLDVKGVSVYLSNPLVPENIYTAHQSMYSRSQFSIDTLWDEMIGCFRYRLQ